MPTPIVEGFSLTHAQICNGTTSFLDSLAATVADDLDIYGVNDASLEPDSDSYENQGDDTTLSRWNWLNFATLTVQGGYLSFPLMETLTGQPMEALSAGTPTSEVQTLASSGATAGTFTLAFGGQTTAPIPFDAAPAAITSALTALSSVGAGNVSSSGGPANSADVVITFSGDLANKDVAQIAVANAGLTGGSHTITTTTEGVDSGASGFGMDLWHEDSFNVPARPGMIVLPSKDHAGAIRRLVIGLYKIQFGPIGFDGPAYKDGLKVNYEGTALMSDVDELGEKFPDGKKRIGRLLSVA